MRVLKAISKDKSLRLKCLGVLGILLLCRLLSDIPTPGVNSEFFVSMIESNASLGFFDALTGGSLSSLSIMALGVTPYITASIILQLLGVVIEPLRELQKSSDKTDQRTFKRITLLSGAGLAVIESLTMAIGFGQQGILTSFVWYNVLLAALVWSCGAVFLSLMGELITDKLVGNGISLILAANILSSFPSDMAQIGEVVASHSNTAIIITEGVLIGIGLILLLAFVVVINSTTRDIPITYSGKLKGSPAYADKRTSSIPLQLCPGSVIPIIFAISLLSFPTVIANFFGADPAALRFFNSSYWFSTAYPFYSLGVILYVALIFGFTYYYIDIAMNPYEMADNLKKAGATVPGIRPGKPTGDYLAHQMHMVSLIGAGAMSVIAVLPYVVGGLTGLSNLSILGTSLIIVVSVTIETKKLLESLTKDSIYVENIRKRGLFNAA